MNVLYPCFYLADRTQSITGGYTVKKLIFYFCMVTLFCFFSCDDKPMEETNPYPDGVYPFEVSNVKQVEHGGASNIYLITWNAPDDKNFSHVQFELFGIIGSNVHVEPDEREYLIYSSIAKDYPFSYVWHGEIVLTKNSFSIEINVGDDKFAIIKCVDKFGNVSNGVRLDGIITIHY